MSKQMPGIPSILYNTKFLPLFKSDSPTITLLTPSILLPPHNLSILLIFHTHLLSSPPPQNPNPPTWCILYYFILPRLFALHECFPSMREALGVTVLVCTSALSMETYLCSRFFSGRHLTLSFFPFFFYVDLLSLFQSCTGLNQNL